MTDEQIVRILAEFMGWTDIRHIDEHYGPVWWIQGRNPEGTLGVFTVTWLTSYDALAPVWQKVYDEFGGETETTAMNSLFYPDITSLETCRAWFLRTPRQHAEALARAIEEGGAR